MILVDSNIWIYFFDPDTAEHVHVKGTLLPMTETEDLLVPTVVQLEVVQHLVRRLRAKSRSLIDTFLAQEAEVEPLTGGLLVEAAHLLVTHHAGGIGARDAAILVSAKRHDALLCTNDKNLTKVAHAMGIKTANPASG